MKKLKFAIVGMGFIYPRHKQAIESLGHEVALTCDIDFTKRPSFTDWIEMYQSKEFEDIDAVAICTPNYLHGIMTREALLRGKKVLCEKPLSIEGPLGLEGVNTVLQLRYNPEIQRLKGNPPISLYVEAKMFRNEKYWNSWKGDKRKSGGTLFNLGVHYIDLLVHLWGDNWKLGKIENTKRMSKGTIYFGENLDKIAQYHIQIVNDKSKQGRKLLADGREIILSNQENLSYEDLHTKVYEEFIASRGIKLSETYPTLRLIKELSNV